MQTHWLKIDIFRSLVTMMIKSLHLASLHGVLIMMTGEVFFVVEKLKKEASTESLRKYLELIAITSFAQIRCKQMTHFCILRA